MLLFKYAIFKLFNQVLLMCKGHIAYQGSFNDVTTYFTEQGYTYGKDDNPPDFALKALIDANQNENKLDKLNQTYQNSSMCARVNADLDEQIHRNDPDSNNERPFKRPVRREIYYLS